MKSSLVIIFLIIAVVIISCNQQELDDLRLENIKLKETIEDNILIRKSDSIRQKFTPITISRQVDYNLGDSVNIFGVLGVMGIRDIQLKVKLDQVDTIIETDDLFRWEYEFIPRKRGVDTLSGVYILNIDRKKYELKFEHILNIW